jgi:hypothetical protein
MSESKESLSAWQYTKGMVLSYIALITALIKSGSIAAEDVIKELDVFINIFTERYPDSIELIETMKLAKDIILELYPQNKASDNTPFAWVSDFIGHA